MRTAPVVVARTVVVVVVVAASGCAGVGYALCGGPISCCLSWMGVEVEAPGQLAVEAPAPPAPAAGDGPIALPH